MQLTPRQAVSLFWGDKARGCGERGHEELSLLPTLLTSSVPNGEDSGWWQRADVPPPHLAPVWDALGVVKGTCPSAKRAHNPKLPHPNPKSILLQPKLAARGLQEPAVPL